MTPQACAYIRHIRQDALLLNLLQSRDRYVGNVEYLKIHMDFLRNKSKAIRQDAFHIFKVFAANPRKPPKVPWSEWIAIVCCVQA